MSLIDKCEMFFFVFAISFGFNSLLSLIFYLFFSLGQVIVGACTVVQNAIPTILSLKESYHAELTNTLERQAMCVYNACKEIECLNPIKPQGAMYVMVGIDISKLKDIKNDSEFAQGLLNEQNVMVLPGSCFGALNFFRIVYCAPEPTLQEVVRRLADFCKSHAL